MTFTIETGSPVAHVYGLDHCTVLMQAVRDGLPEDATQAQIDDMVCQYVIGDLRAPKTMQTVRNHLLRYWPLIAPLASREPDLFDSILNEFSERASL